MNYQHHYHAGNHADVFKHLVLVMLASHYQQKEKPFCIVDTHAGSGKYNLIASGDQEYFTGIGLLHQEAKNIKHDFIQQYLNLQKDLSDFSGSPFIAKSYLRQQDALILIEKDEAPYQSLKKYFSRDPQTSVHHLSAEAAFKALFPPHIKRGIVFIDPTYEETDEYERWLHKLKDAFKKFSTACYALWFPIKSKNKNRVFYERFKKMNFNSADKLLLEFCPLPSDIGTRFNGSGILLVNPPFQFEKNIKPLLKELLTHLKQDSRGFQLVEKA